MLDDLMVLNEISENDRLIDVEETIIGLQMAGSRLTNVAKNTEDVECKNNTIDSLNAIISAMTYMTIMNSTVDAIRNDIQERKGGASC